MDCLPGCYITSNYDHATSLLDKLQQLAGFQGTQTTFDTRLKMQAGVNIKPRYLHFTARQYKTMGYEIELPQKNKTVLRNQTIRLAHRSKTPA